MFEILLAVINGVPNQPSDQISATHDPAQTKPNGESRSNQRACSPAIVSNVIGGRLIHPLHLDNIHGCYEWRVGNHTVGTHRLTAVRTR